MSLKLGKAGIIETLTLHHNLASLASLTERVDGWTDLSTRYYVTKKNGGKVSVVPRRGCKENLRRSQNNMVECNWSR